jgi:hypothetical protein
MLKETTELFYKACCSRVFRVDSSLYSELGRSADVANEYGSFGIERCQVSLGAQRRSEQPPGRDMDRSLHLFSAEVAPTNRRHLASLYFSGNPSIETLGIVFYPYSPEHDVLQIHVSLHNDDFAYYYEVAQTEKLLYFLYVYSTDVDPNTNAMPLLRANVGSSTEPLGEGLPDVSP